MVSDNTIEKVSPEHSEVSLEHQAEFLALYKKRLIEVQEECRTFPQLELPLLHDFAPGLYMRRIFMPRMAFVIGRTHKTEHFNIVLSGSALVMIDGEIELIKAPCVFKSKAGCKKTLHILEDMIWMTTHPTDETDLEKLAELCVCSDEEEQELLELELKRLA